MNERDDHEGSRFLRHIPCTRCGSRDNNSIYTDGHQYCFGCNTHIQGEGAVAHQPAKRKVEGLIDVEEVRGLRLRKISDQTCQHFGYGIGTYKGQDCQIAPYYNADGQLVAQKLRFKDKTFKVRGDLGEALPFGAHCWAKGGKKIVVTEGEIDAMTMSQVQGNKWPVVSIGCGAGPQVRKYFAQRLDYFKGFEEVVIMFDNDEPGREAAKLAAGVIGARAKIAELPLKDANEMLLADKVDELINAMWKAKQYRPEGVVDLSDIKDEFMRPPEMGLSWPFPTLTKATYGIRPGEIYSLGAGTGVGKTDFFAQCIKHMLVEHKVSVGVFSFEQSPAETAVRIAGKLVEKMLHIPDGDWTQDERQLAFDTMQASGNLYLYDSFGVNDWAVVKEKMEYLHYAYDVRYFFIDHLTALAASEDDERKALEKLMADLSATAKRLACAVFLISHLATPEGKPHEEGGRVMIRHFKGSRSIGFWSHYMFGMERAQQDPNEIRRKTTTFRILKARFSGAAVGDCIYLGYDQKTGMLYETLNPEVTEGMNAEEEEL